MDQPLLTLGIAAGLGLLVGLQRERAAHAEHVGGIRTYPLATLLGAAAGLVAPVLGGWLAASGLIGVVAVALLSNVQSIRRGDPEPGVTSEIAIMVMYAVGVMLGIGMRDPAIALGVGAAILLQLKAPLHTLASKVGDTDVRAVLQFALITFIILPVLPDQTYGPFDVLNPYRIWLMVVLVVGLSLAGYIAFRVLGRDRGTLVAGLTGGLISSTATTASYARLGKVSREPALPRIACAIFLLATVVMYGRVIIEIFVVSPTHAREIVGPVAVVGAAALLLTALSLRNALGGGGDVLQPENPAQLKSAVVFGGLYGLVLLLVAAGKHFFGQSGLYAVAAISGLTDMDAITLSTGRLVERGRLDPESAWRAVVLASISNLAFKAGMVWVLGGIALARRTALWFFGVALAGVAVLLLW